MLASDLVIDEYVDAKCCASRIVNCPSNPKPNYVREYNAETIKLYFPKSNCDTWLNQVHCILNTVWINGTFVYVHVVFVRMAITCTDMTHHVSFTFDLLNLFYAVAPRLIRIYAVCYSDRCVRSTV